VNRRTVIKGGAAGLVATPLAACSGADGDSGVEPGQIDHVVVVMMENRSFDHFLGALLLDEGREVDGLTGSESNPDRDGAQVPVYHLDVDCQSDPPHGWTSTHNQVNDGEMDGFLTEHANRVGDDEGQRVMGYYTRDDLPIHYALADGYAVPDRYFCAVQGPTWPNRLYAQTGTSDGLKGNDTSQVPFTMTTVYEALANAGVEWKYYYTDLPFIGVFEDHWDPSRIDMLDDFIRDCEHARLPAFSWIDPGFGYNDDHPPHHVGLGQMFLAVIHEALARSELWDRCLLVITYDEHGGFYDHVEPDTVEDEHAEDGFDSLGVRIPALLVGPWVSPGVHSTTFDHTSVLRYVAERFGIEPWTTRMATANSIEAMLDVDRMATGVPLDPVVLPSFEVPEDEVGSHCMYGPPAPDAPVSGQPELESWVREHMPETDRTDRQAELHQFLLDRARGYGLIDS
jgi:phospholipase C